MNRATLVLFFILSFSTSFSQQPIKEYVLGNTIAVRSITINDSDFTDIEPIGDAIGDARIVLLGEQDHGDAPAFMAKARLVKYLHEKKGFTVLAFESDFYSINTAEKEFVQKSISFQQLLGNIFSIWTKCSECKDVFTYMENTYKGADPLILTGFDSQLHGVARTKTYKQDVVNMLNAIRPFDGKDQLLKNLNPYLDYIEKFYPLDVKRNISKDSLQQFIVILDSLNNKISYLPNSSYTKILMQSLHAWLMQTHYWAKDDYDMMTVRDKQMAENLLWLYRYKFRGQKIIVWAHNYHVAKNTYEAFPPRSGRHTSMGHTLWQTLQDSIYILGFDSYEGRAGRIYLKNYEVVKPNKDGFENWVAESNKEYAFVDFKKYRKDNPGQSELFFMKGKYHENAEAKWTDVFDGVFYIKTMYPCAPLNLP